MGCAQVVQGSYVSASLSLSLPLMVAASGSGCLSYCGNSYLAQRLVPSEWLGLFELIHKLPVKCYRTLEANFCLPC